MRISLSGLKDFDPQVSTEHGVRIYKSGRLLGKVLQGEERVQGFVQPVIVDPKAARHV